MANRAGLIDLHMHTTASDGTDTPEELLAAVRAAGIGVFSVTDHDAIKAVKALRPLLGENDPRFIPGVEFSCRDDGGKYHILGYRYDPSSEALLSVIGHAHALRLKKLSARLGYLKSEFGFDFPPEETDRLYALDNPGKPHIANAMVRLGYAKTKEEAMHEYLNRVHFKSEYVRPEEAIKAILSAHGLPVLAHPFYGSGDELILGDEMEKRLGKLIGYGLRGLEAFYSGFPEKLRREALALADRYGLYVTAGSDYHGKNKLVKLGDTGLSDEKVLPEGLWRFLDDCLDTPRK